MWYGRTATLDSYFDPTRGNNMYQYIETKNKLTDLEGRNREETQTSSVPNQSGMQENTIGTKDTNSKVNNPFARSKLTGRSPMRQRERLNSLPDINLGSYGEPATQLFTDDITDRSQKRKRTDNACGNGKQTDYEVDLDPWKEIDILERKLDNLRQCISSCPTTKADIKKSADELQHAFKRYKRQTLREINQKNQVPICNTTSNEIRCKECEIANTNAKKKNLYKKEETYSNFKSIEESDWESEMFTKLPVIDGNIWETSTENTLVIPCNEGFESKEKTVSIALNKFGGIDGLKGQGKKKGEVAFMTQTLGFPNEEGEMIYQSRTIFYPLVTDINGQEDEEDTFKSLLRVKGAALKNGATNLVTVQRTGPVGETWNRMLQYIFDGSKMQIKMYKQREAKNIHKRKQPKTQKGTVSLTSEGGYKSDTNTPRNRINNEVEKSNKRITTRTKDALLVKMENKSYSDVLKIVRSSIDPEAIGVEVNSVGKTKKGDLLVTVKNGEHETQNLKTEIQKKIPEARISIMINKKILHFKGMEEDVTTEDIQKSIIKETESDSRLIEVRAIRPAFGGRKNATVILPDNEANKLIQKGKLKIGWTFCKILERKKDSRCLKCWEYGHLRDQCQGPDRDNLCRKCTQEGHKAAVCTGKPFCLFCKKEGHLSNTRLCQQIQNFQ